MKYKNITIKKNLKCNTWYARYRFGGKQYYVSGKTQKDVYNKLKQILNDNTKLLITHNKTLQYYTFEEWLNIWFETFKKDTVRETTIKSYKSLLKLLSKPFTKTLMKDINSIIIKKEIEQTSATRQKQKLFIILKDIFERAVEQKVINENPIKYLKKPVHEQKHGTALTPSQEKIFINQCKSLNNDVGDFFLVVLYQGLRKGEALAIKPDDIDLINMKLKIDESINDYTKDTKTKNKTSNRIMPLFEKTKEILIKYLNNNINNRIFIRSKDFLQKQYKQILSSANLPEFKIHELRHTFITRCQEKNIPEHIIQSWVGHQIGSVITKKVYTHPNDEVNKQYIDLINSSKNEN